MLKILRPTTALFATLLGGALLLPTMALADSHESAAMDEERSAMEEHAAESEPGEGMMEDDPDLLGGGESAAMQESQEAMAEDQAKGTSGQLADDPELLEGGESAAMKEEQEAMDE